MRYVFGLLVVVSMLFMPFVAPRPVSACSGGFDGTLREHIELFYRSELVDAVTLAEITGVRRLSPSGAPLTTASGFPSLIPANAEVATFAPEVLWTNLGLAGNTVGPVGYGGADCSGGPSFERGDKVLMFLTKPRYGVSDYSLGALSLTLLFRGSEAFYLTPGRYLMAAGSTQEVIEYLLSVAGSPETTSGPARAFLGLTP
jgi:hypothetical protein